MSNVFKSRNVNYKSNGYEIKSRDRINQYITFEEAEQSLALGADEQKELFYFEMEQEKKKIIDNAKIEAQVNAQQVFDQKVNDANTKVAELMRNAEKELNLIKSTKDKIEKDAYEAGYNKGLRDTQELIDEANEVLDNITETRKIMLSNSQNEIIRLLYDLFIKVIGVELDINNDLIVNLIERTFREFELKHSIVIKVSSDDYAYVVDNKNAILSRFKGIDNFEIVMSESLSKGDCIIQTASGEIDSSISTQLRCIKDILKRILFVEND